MDAGSLVRGNYSFLIYYQNLGYASIKAFFIVSGSVYVINTIQSSYYGGKKLTISGDGISSLSTLDIAGINATLISSSSNQLIYRVPPYVTYLSQ